LTVDCCATAAHVQDRRRGDALFRCALGHRLQILEIIGFDAAAPFEPAADFKARRRALDFLLPRFKFACDVLLGDALFDGDASKLPEKVGVPDGPAIFAIRDALQADLFLQLRHIANTAVFDFPQRRGGQFAFLMLIAGEQELRRPQQTADVIGAKRCDLFRHRCFSSKR